MTSIHPTDDPEHSAPRPTHVVFGGDHVGRSVAEHMRTNGHVVAVAGGSTGESTDIERLVEAGVSAASTVVVATQSDARNLLVAQRVRVRFEVSRIVVLVNHPERLDAIEAAGYEPFCATTALSETLVECV